MARPTPGTTLSRPPSSSFLVNRYFLERMLELPERPPQEALRSLMGRTIEDVQRFALFDDSPLVHEDDAVAHLTRELHLVRDDEHRHPVVREIAHDDEHLPDELGVERRRDLVEEHHVWVHHQRAGDRDPLLLAARELMRVLPLLLRQPHALEQLTGPLLRLVALELADTPHRDGQVVDHPQVREEVELLEDDPDALPHGRDVDAPARDLLALEEDPPLVERLQQVDAAEQRALAAPTRADDDQHLAGVDAEVDPVQDEVVAEALAHAFEPDDRNVTRRRTFFRRSGSRHARSPSLSHERKDRREAPHKSSGCRRSGVVR